MFSSRLSVVNYYHQQNLSGSLSHNPVNSIVEDEYQTLWVGTESTDYHCQEADSHTINQHSFVSHM